MTDASPTEVTILMTLSRIEAEQVAQRREITELKETVAANDREVRDELKRLLAFKNRGLGWAGAIGFVLMLLGAAVDRWLLS